MNLNSFIAAINLKLMNVSGEFSEMIRDSVNTAFS